MLTSNEERGEERAPRGPLTALIVLCTLGVLFAAILIIEKQFGHDLRFGNLVDLAPNATSTGGLEEQPPASPSEDSIATSTATASSTYHIATTTENMPRPGYKRVITTLFWAGEGETADNGFIQNYHSAWDEEWSIHFGGVDDPECRNGYFPCTFTPKENPFYFALPYGEYGDDGAVKASAQKIPWYAESQKNKTPLLKNRWIEVVYNGKTCYGQWEDVGPFEEDDFAYVFGNAKPKNQFGEKAGLDISPALWTCLGMKDNTLTEWRFVESKDVPPGPWKNTVTTSGLNWK